MMVLQHLVKMDDNAAKYTNELLTGKVEINFGETDCSLIIDKFAPKQKKLEKKSILGGLSVMRSKWSNLFSKLGGSLDAADIQTFKQLFGGKFKNYLRFYL